MMIKFVPLLFLSLSLYASEFSYIIGGVTPHIQKPQGKTAKPLCNELKKDSGVIYNELNSYRYTTGDKAYGMMVGENSYCSPIWGFTGSHNFVKNPNLEVMGTVGFYHFEREDFDFSKGAYFSNIGNFYFVPIAGIEINYVIYRNKSLQVKTMNLLTPVITHHSIGLVFDI